MSRGESYWAGPMEDGRWSVRRPESRQPSSVHASRDEAWKEARRLARGGGGQAVLLGVDGRIRTRNDYDD
jgi:hypothetical protein